jgi:hypothetical protein
MLHKVFAFVSLSTVTLINSCTTKVEGLQVSEAFNHQTVTTDRFVLAGVTNASEEASDKTASRYLALLRTKLLDERKDLRIGPNADFNALMGNDASAVLKAYNTTGSLDEANIAKMANKLKGYRFAVFARIENDATHVDRSETSGREVTDSKGKKSYEPGSITVSNVRTVTSSMYIVDLLNKNTAFSGSVTKSERNESRYQKDLGNAIVSVIQATKGSDPHPAPAAPPTDKVLGKVFTGFAENFPEKD